MAHIFGDAVLGRLIFTDNAIAKMHRHGLYRFQVLETLKHGFSVQPLIPGTLQRQHRLRAEYDVTVAFKTIDQQGDPLGGMLIVTCWKKRVL